MVDKVNLAAAFASFDDPWAPRVAADVNEFQVKLAKLEGEFVWHAHDEEDELFLVVRGRLVMRFRDGDVTLDEGEMLVVPAGVEHLPIAPDGTADVVLIERAATVNTGTAGGDRTRAPQPLQPN